MAETLRKIGEDQTIVAARPATTIIEATVENGVPFSPNVASQSQTFWVYKSKRYSSLRAAQRANITDLCDTLQIDVLMKEKIVDIFPHLIAQMVEYPTTNLFKSADGKFFTTAAEAFKYNESISVVTLSNSPKEVQVE